MSPIFEILDHRRFRPLVVANAQLERLHTGMRWAEGPVWFPDMQALLFSDIPNDRILRWVEGQPASVFREPSNHANGNTRDRQGRLVTCESGARRLTRTEPDGSITVLAERFEGKRLNSPNDVVVRADGTIWFTDPDYGILSDFTGTRAQSEIGRNLVFRLDPDGRLASATDEVGKPNGIAFSADGRTLYVADSARSHDPEGAHHILAWDVDEAGSLSRRRVFAEIEPGVPDGFRLDVDGNVWSSAADGVHCFAPDGALIGRITVPEPVANLTFGGRRRSRLFITAGASLYAVYVGTRGAESP